MTAMRAPYIPEGFVAAPAAAAMHAAIIAEMAAHPTLDYLAAARQVERQQAAGTTPGQPTVKPFEGGLRFSGVAYAGAYLPAHSGVVDLSTAMFKDRLPLVDQDGTTVGVVDAAQVRGKQLHVAGTIFAGTKTLALAQQGAALELNVIIDDETKRAKFVDGEYMLCGARIRAIRIGTLGDPGSSFAAG